MSSTFFEVEPFAEKAEFKNPVGLATDASGNIYVSDCGLHGIIKISPSGDVSVLAGGKEKGYKDGQGQSACFYRCGGITVDSHGNLLVCDSGNNRIRKITPDGVVTTIAGSGAEGAEDGIGIRASFRGPQGVVVDSKDNIFIADTLNDCIRKISPTGVVTTVAGKAGNRGKADGIGSNASFDRPHGLWLDVQSTLFCADSQNNLIRTIDIDTGAVSKWVGVGMRGHRDGGKFAVFALPTFVVADSCNLFIADTDNNCIRRVDSSGAVHTVAGGKAAGYADGFGDKALFNHPRAILLDPFTSTLIVADSLNAKLRKCRPVDEVQWHESMLQQAQQFKEDAIREVAEIEVELQKAQKRKADAIVALGLAQRHLEQARAKHRPLLTGAAPLLLK